MDIKEYILKEYEFLSLIDSATRDIIMDNMIINEYEIGHRLFSANQSCTGFSLILNGGVRVYRIGDDGREVTIYKLKKGDSCIKTIICMLTNSENNSFADVEENATIALIPLEIFNNHLLNNADFLQYAFRNLYKKFDDVIDTLEKVTFSSIESRLIDYFNNVIGEDKPKGIIYATHEKIAGDIGSTREVVSRSLKALEKKGVIELSRGKIKYNREKL